jgi:lactate dehydrogenase-like 2-hydroxyacid dehydrogenase
LATRSAGTDHIDFGAAKANGIEVVNVPDYGSQSIAEYAVTLALSLAAGLSPKDGQEDMGRVEYGLARLFAHAKKLDETISRVRAGNYQRSGLKGLNLLDQSQDRKIFIGGKNDAPDEAVLKEIGLKIAQDPGEADFYWGDAQQIKISEIKQGAIVINMGDIPNAELTGQFKARGAVLETIPKKVKGVSLRGRTMGVIGGAGKIGINTVRIARALGMIVLVYDVDMVSGQAVGLKKQYGFEYASLEELLSRSDVVSLHVPFIPGKTEHMIDAKRIAMMKQGAMLINTARGPVVDTPAVIEALKSGHIAAAGLDVIEGEPGIFPQAQGVAQQATEEQKINLNTLAAMPNVYVTPHNAFNTTASAWSMLHITAQSITDKTADPASVAVVKKTSQARGDRSGYR